MIKIRSMGLATTALWLAVAGCDKSEPEASPEAVAACKTAREAAAKSWTDLATALETESKKFELTDEQKKARADLKELSERMAEQSNDEKVKATLAATDATEAALQEYRSALEAGATGAKAIAQAMNVGYIEGLEKQNAEADAQLAVDKKAQAYDEAMRKQLELSGRMAAQSYPSVELITARTETIKAGTAASKACMDLALPPKK